MKALEDALRVIPNAQIACGKRPPMPRRNSYLNREGGASFFVFALIFFFDSQTAAP